MSHKSAIIDFYSLEKADNRNRYLPEIWQKDDHWLEATHDYIQWLFPLKERSRFNVNAPILSDEDIQQFRNREYLKINVLKSLSLMLRFYGLALIEDDQTANIIIDQSFNHRKKVWVHWGNHNHLRITRILKSLCLLGLQKYAQALFKCLEEIYNLEKGEITNLTFSYWEDAVILGDS